MPAYTNITSGRSNDQNKNLDLQFIINDVTESEEWYLKQIEYTIEVKKIKSRMGLACEGKVTGVRRLGEKGQSYEQTKAKLPSYTYHHFQASFPPELLC